MLAFTVLGIDYNPSTGDCQFLILVRRSLCVHVCLRTCVLACL